jgi:hypothetical protein
MRARLAIALGAVALAAVAWAAPTEARAADPVVARDTLVYKLYALGGDLVYFRAFIEDRAWMARFHGHLHRARGIPSPGNDPFRLGELGWSRDGHKVFTFGVGDRPEWFAYDLERNETSRLRGLPSGCNVSWAAVWRRSMAYAALCDRPEDSGTFVRRRGHTQKVRDFWLASGIQAFRGGTLVVGHEGGEADAYLEQWMANGKRCIRTIAGSSGDAIDITDWYPSNVWLGGGYVTWTMGNPRGRSDFAIVGAKLARGCDAPGPTGLLAFKPQGARVTALAVDGRRVFYAGGHALRSHLLPASPSIKPPRNDDFKHAKRIFGDVPKAATGRLGHATVQRGEPLRRARHTVWYAWRPAHSGQVNIFGGCTTALPESCYGPARFGVYTGSRRDALKEIRPLDRSVTQVDAVAGKTYWIAVGSAYPPSPREPSYEPFTIHIDPA